MGGGGGGGGGAGLGFARLALCRGMTEEGVVSEAGAGVVEGFDVAWGVPDPEAMAFATFDELEELAPGSVRVPPALVLGFDSFVGRASAICAALVSPFVVCDRCFFCVGWYTKGGVVGIVGTNTAGSFAEGGVDLYT